MLIPFSLFGLPLFLSLFWAAAFAASHLLVRRLKLSRSMHLVHLIIFMAIFDYSRGFIFTGFPWNAMGLVLAVNDQGLTMASVAGYWGGGLLVLIFAALPALLMVSGRLLASFAMVMIAVVFGLAHLSVNHIDSPSTGLSVRIIQPNIAQNDKWDHQKRRKHLSDMVVASRQEGARAIDLLVWPETAFAGIYEDESGVISAISQAASSGKTPVVMGAISSKEDPFRIYNSAFMFAPDGSLSGSVSKRRLVPFGEYAPFRSVLPFVDAIASPLDFSKGSGPQSLTINGITALTLICYEVIFPSAVHKALDDEGGDIIIAMTNDAWFGDTIGPRQHLAMAQFRSAELGIPMIRSANTGVSALINSQGQIDAFIDYGETGYIDGIIGPSRHTFYGIIGDWIYVVLVFVFGAGAICICLTEVRVKE